jgi:hypothetical protein
VNKQKNRMWAKWLAGMVLIVSLTLLTGPASLPQDYGQQYGLGDIPLDPATYQRHLKVWPERMAAEGLPPAYDARTEGIVTPAKNQGSCGSCWAFASVGAMESHLLKAYQFGPTDLSEQQQVSCNLGMAGCCGGSSTAIRFWEDKGPIYEGCFGYGESGTSCSTQRTVPCANAGGCEQLGYRVVDWHTVQATPDGFKTSLYLYGPSYWRYDVYSDFYTYWNYGSPGDVYVSTSGKLEGGHAVLLIGWDDSKGAYLCKNSWGENRGPNGDGTFWIAYTGHLNNLSFGMANFSLTSVGCTGDAECDDGVYCNGAETCANGLCQSGTPPSCADDGLFCNGSEVCDEFAKSCGSSGYPCEEGTTCDEDANRCILPACGNGTCDLGENCTNCPGDCFSGTGGGSCTACFKGACDGVCHPVKEGPECSDCAPSWCCGDGVCEGQEDGVNCAVDCGDVPGCGDGICDPGEDRCSCAADCGAPAGSETDCGNGVDDDCDGFVDCADAECSGDLACPACLPKGSVCDAHADCCSNKCRAGTCK